MYEFSCWILFKAHKLVNEHDTKDNNELKEDHDINYSVDSNELKQDDNIKYAQLHIFFSKSAFTLHSKVQILLLFHDWI